MTTEIDAVTVNEQMRTEARTALAAAVAAHPDVTEALTEYARVMDATAHRRYLQGHGEAVLRYGAVAVECLRLLGELPTDVDSPVDPRWNAGTDDPCDAS
jgi:hypothetical protein